MTYLNKWFQFIKERFNPLSYSIMIIVFFGAHYSVYLGLAGQQFGKINIQPPATLTPLVLAVFIFFLKLRLFDEVKDFEDDVKNYPKRPLPRGLLRRNDILRVVFWVIILELMLFSVYGPWAFASASFAIGYSLLMYKEFFLRKWLRLHLTTYAATHTFVVVFISITIFVSLFKAPFSGLPLNIVYFSLGSWFIFNIFEFGRKTFASQEEKNGINSYSKIFGRFGAVMLVLAMAILGNLFIEKGVVFSVNAYLLIWTALLVIAGLIYAVSNKALLGKLYRAATSIYIILIYGTIAYLQFCNLLA